MADPNSAAGFSFGLPEAGAIGGLAFGVLGAIFGNKAAKRARDRAIAQEQIRASIEIGNNALRARIIKGSREVSLGERNVFGRSSQAALLSDVNAGLKNEETLLLEEFFNKARIRSQANGQKQSLFTSGISGGFSGFQLGSNINRILNP